MFSHQEIVLHLLFLSVWKFCCCATQVSYCAFLRILSRICFFFRFIITLALLRNLCVFTNCFVRDASPRGMTVSEVTLLLQFCDVFSSILFTGRESQLCESLPPRQGTHICEWMIGCADVPPPVFEIREDFSEVMMLHGASFSIYRLG